MKRQLSSVLVLFVLCVGAAFAAETLRASEPAPQAAAASAESLDPALRLGELPNGVRYAVRANGSPKGRASLRLVVHAGSFDETEAQRGLAHFLEHLAFNGSTHFPAGTLDAFFQNMGMSVGGDTNASTSFDKTTYMLELADTSAAALGDGLRVLTDFAGGLSLAPEQIEKERGIILSEKRARDTAANRVISAHGRFLLGGTRIPERAPIGLAEVIERAGREQFLDFYNTWYRPENLAVVVVGDFEVAAAEKLVREAFAGLVARAPTRPRANLGQVDFAPGLKVGFHPDAAANSVSMSLCAVAPIEAAAKKPIAPRERMARDIATRMLNRRLQALAARGDAPFSSASVAIEEEFKLQHNFSVDIVCAPTRWAEALATAEQAVRRALEHGFFETEVQAEVADRRRQMQAAVNAASARRSPALANELAAALHARQMPRNPQGDLALFGPALDQVTAADCVAALRAEWSPPAKRLFAAGNLALQPEEFATQATAAYEKSLATPVVALPPETKPVWAYTDFGKPGEIVRREHVADLDLTLVTFANGVRLNLKSTPFEPGRIGVGLGVGHGAMSAPAHPRGLSRMADAVLGAGGLGRHSVDELRRIFERRDVSARFKVTDDAFILSGGTNRADLALELQLIAAKLTDPGYRPEALATARAKFAETYAGFARSPMGVMSIEVPSLLADGDARLAMPPKEELLAITADDLRAWIEPELTHGAIEIAMVGDLDVDATIDAVAATLGALPRRDATPPQPEWLRVSYPATPFVRHWTFDSSVQRGLVALFWPATDGIDARQMRRLRMLGGILAERLRLKIREEMGDTYSPTAGCRSSDAYPGYGYFTAAIDVAPESAEKVAAAAIAVADDLARHGITPEEFRRAHQPILTAIRESERNNSYWLNAVLSLAQSKPETLDWARTRPADIAGITKADLDELARRYLGAARASRAIVLPATPAPVGEGKAGQ